MSFFALELCAGGGGQALGLEMAGFHHAAAVEYEPQFCTTLRTNRPHWNVVQQDIRNLRPNDFTGIDLLAAGVPCPPFSIAGKQLGSDDERDMFPAALAMVEGVRPRGVLFENVPGFASDKFKDYRNGLITKLAKLGYEAEWRVLQAAEFGVPQLRPRFVLVGLRAADAAFFRWPIRSRTPLSVGETLVDLMGSNGWLGAEAWAEKASGIGPTVVGGSKKHGGPDLGPTRARAQWRELHVDGIGIANEPPDESFAEHGIPKLTVRMVARIQGFPDTWHFTGKKTVSYRQVGNAFPPPVARAVGRAVISAFRHQTVCPQDGDPLTFELRPLEEPGTPKKYRRTRASYV
jgi:DNA (cytosine-5)-methyltransferase 1